MDFETLRKAVQDKLKITLLPADEGSLNSLNDISYKLLRRMRRIRDSQLTVELLAFYLPPEHHPYISSYNLRVILGAQDAATWRKGLIWIPDTSLRQQLCNGIEQIFEPFVHEIHFIVPPSLSFWHQGESIGGCFAFPDNARTYLTEPPKGYLSHDPELKLVPIDKSRIPNLFRRWIAQRIARYLHSKKLLRYPIDLPLLEAIAPQSQWTPDAHKAIAGLNRELQEGLINLETTVPGYGGPDEWYE